MSNTQTKQKCIYPFLHNHYTVNIKEQESSNKKINIKHLESLNKNTQRN